MVENPVLIPGSGRIPWGRKWQPTPIFMPGKFPSQRSLADYHSPGGCKEWKIQSTDTDTLLLSRYSREELKWRIWGKPCPKKAL